MKNFLNNFVSRIPLALFITAVWVGLWGDVSFANVASGLLLAGGILTFHLGSPRSNGFRVGPLLRLTWLVLVDLVTSTISVGYEVIRPLDKTDESIIAVNLPDGSERHLLLLTTLITVTPGTAVVDADPANGVLFLHLLHHNKADATIRHVVELAELTYRGLPIIGQDTITKPTTGVPS